MTTPSSPPISMKDVASELGVSSVGLSLSDSRVRALAGIASGPISLHDLLGKSAYTPMSPDIGTGGGYSGPESGYSWGVTCSPGGGVAPYAYSWAVSAQSPPGCATLTSPTTQTCDLGLSVSGGLGSTAQCEIQCTVTDGKGDVVASNTTQYFLDFV